MRKTWGHLAAAWAVLFAAVHLYWGFGGETGLDVSAGPLAESRPAAFVMVGLFGVAGALLVGAVIALLLARHPRRPRPLVLLGWTVAALLLLRGFGLTLLMALGIVHTGDGITSAQLTWTWVLWNPWFVLGGICFALASRPRRTASRARPGTP